MATRDQVLALLDEGHTYETAARELDIPPGRAFMIATGLPADGGTSPAAGRPVSERALEGSPQRLVNPPPHNPTRSDEVMEWVRGRAARELGRG